MNIDAILNQVQEFAAAAHGDQQRKFTPEAYIAHPVRVMGICRMFTSDVAILAAALLHDVVEDTDVKPEEIKDFLLSIMERKQAGNAVRLVHELTDIYTKQNYPQWNRRTRKGKEVERLEKVSPAAQTIKYADIIDNSLHLDGAENDFARLYLVESRTILKELQLGLPGLHEKALETISQCLLQYPVHKKSGRSRS